MGGGGGEGEVRRAMTFMTISIHTTASCNGYTQQGSTVKKNRGRGAGDGGGGENSRW